MLTLFNAEDSRVLALREKSFSVSCLDLATSAEDAATLSSSDGNDVEPRMGGPPVVTTAMKELVGFLRSLHCVNCKQVNFTTDSVHCTGLATTASLRDF